MCLRRLLACALVLSAASAALAGAVGSGQVSGLVRDPAGAPVPGASVSLLSALGAIAGTGASDAEGAFRFDAVPSGSYVLTAGSPGFAKRRLAFQVEGGGAVEALALDLRPEAFRDEVTVTAIPGRAAALEDVAQRVNVIGEEKIALRSKAVLAPAMSEEVGLHLQRTSPRSGVSSCAGSPAPRSTCRRRGALHDLGPAGGISTFFDMVAPEALEGIEVVRGPSSAEYGSDALGGTVQLLTPGHRLQPRGPARLRQLERELRQRGRELRLGPRDPVRRPHLRPPRHPGRAPRQHAPAGRRDRLKKRAPQQNLWVTSGSGSRPRL